MLKEEVVYNEFKNKNLTIFLICLLVNIVIVCIAIFVFGTNLCMDDDSILSWMAYGVISEPSSRVYYSNVILGWIYKHLFNLFPGFNWQTLIHYLGLIYSGTLGLYAVKRTNKNNVLILWFLFEVIFFQSVYINLTFSIVAAFAGCQGYLTLLLSVKERIDSTIIYILCGLALGFSSMVRFDSFLGVSGFAFFVWVIIFVWEVGSIANATDLLKRFAYPFVFVLGFCFLLYGVDRLAYSSGEWKSYKEHEDASSIITDSRTAINYEGFSAFEDKKITQTMTRAIIEWRNNDPEVLNTKVMKTINCTAEKYNKINNPLIWKDFFVQLRIIALKYYELYFAFLILILSICTGSFKNNYLYNNVKLLVLAPFFFELFYFAYIGRMDGGTYPERCVYIVIMGLAMSNIIICGAQEEMKDSTMTRLLLSLIAVSAVAVLGTKEFEVKGLGLVDVEEIQSEYKFLGEGEKVYICEYDVRTELEESFGAWQTPESGFMGNTIEIGTWFVNHPMLKKHMASLGFANPYRALFEMDNVYYIRSHPSDEQILDYLKENYDEKITMEYVKEKGGYKVFRYYLE